MFGAWPWACRIPVLRRSIILPGLPFVREWLCDKFVVDLCCHQCWHSGFSAYNLFFLLYSCILNYALWCVMNVHAMCSAHHTTTILCILLSSAQALMGWEERSSTFYLCSGPSCSTVLMPACFALLALWIYGSLLHGTCIFTRLGSIYIILERWGIFVIPAWAALWGKQSALV